MRICIAAVVLLSLIGCTGGSAPTAPTKATGSGANDPPKISDDANQKVQPVTTTDGISN
jgi:hypothetical protein